MLTKDIKIDGIYARKRGDAVVRFKVKEIITRRNNNSGNAATEIVGHIIEDEVIATHKNMDGQRKTADKDIRVAPADLLGPISQYLELVERQKAEKLAEEKREQEQERQALTDRLMLYRFIGVDAPKDPERYNQMFRVKYGALSIQHEGDEAIIARIRNGGWNAP